MRGHLDDDNVRDELVDLREIVVEHHREIFRFARSLTYCDADAEDLAQTAVVRALQRGVIVSDEDRAKSYVLRIVQNLAADQARRRARIAIDPYGVVPELEIADDTLDDIASAAVFDDALPRGALAALSDAERAVLRMRFLDEMGYRDVAAKMDTTEHGARQRVYRALRVLRNAINDRTSPAA
jgi:RNA polymerase sigma-70 factor (ECF subfamily)